MKFTAILHNVVKQIVFDQRLRRKHLDWSSTNKDAHLYDYIKSQMAEDVCDRIEDMIFSGKRNILNIGSCSGLIIKNLNPARVESLTQTDISSKSIERCEKTLSSCSVNYPINYIQCDEECLPLKENSMDLVMSCATLHWVNDLLKCFQDVRKILKPNSPFLGVIFGGETLYELRSSLQLAELERLSGFSSHVAPKTTGQDISRLLQMSGFQLITVDMSQIKIRYPSIFELMFDLQGMGENNCSLIGAKHIDKDVLMASAAIYQSLYGNDDIESGIPATFQLIHFVGWNEPGNANPIDNNK